jgi:hypothetical protein
VQVLLQASKNVLGYSNKAGTELYAARDDVRKAGFLNIMAKCGLQELRECRGDRFFVQVTQQLREDTKNSVARGNFFEVPEVLLRGLLIEGRPV